jgi:hypothetical protein
MSSRQQLLYLSQPVYTAILHIVSKQMLYALVLHLNLLYFVVHDALMTSEEA